MSSEVEFNLYVGRFQLMFVLPNKMNTFLGEYLPEYLNIIYEKKLGGENYEIKK